MAGLELFLLPTRSSRSFFRIDGGVGHVASNKSPPPTQIRSSNKSSPLTQIPSSVNTLKKADTSPAPKVLQDVKTFSINNAASGENSKTSCVAVRIKRRNGGVRSLQAILDSGNDLPHVALSLEAFQTPKQAGIMKSGLMKTDIKATKADSNQIDVVGTAEGNWTIYFGKKPQIQ